MTNPPQIEKRSIGGEALDAAVVPIRHVDRPVAGHVNALWQIKLPFTAAFATPLAEERPVGSEALDAAVVPVRYVDCPVASRSDAGRPIELPFVASLAAPLTKVCTCLLYTSRCV